MSRKSKQNSNRMIDNRLVNSTLTPEQDIEILKQNSIDKIAIELDNQSYEFVSFILRYIRALKG